MCLCGLGLEDRIYRETGNCDQGARVDFEDSRRCVYNINFIDNHYNNLWRTGTDSRRPKATVVSSSQSILHGQPRLIMLGLQGINIRQRIFGLLQPVGHWTPDYQRCDMYKVSAQRGEQHIKPAAISNHATGEDRRNKAAC
jgi:hypothetical protein